MSAQSEELTSASLGELLGRLSADTATLVRQELGLAQVELVAKARRAGRAALLLGAAGGAAAVAAGTSTVLVLRLLDQWLPPRTSALVATLLYGSAAAALGTAGVAEARRSLPAMPEETAQSLREDARWLKTRNASVKT